MSSPAPPIFYLWEKKMLKSPLPLSSNNKAKNFLFPGQVACIEDHAEFVLENRKVGRDVSRHSQPNQGEEQLWEVICATSFLLHAYLPDVRPETQL